MKIAKIIKFILLLSLITFAVSFWQKDKLPAKSEILQQLYNEPSQKETTNEPFSVEKNGIIYSINPLYDYELNGLIVSYNHSANWWDYYHKKWGDVINLKDLCVVWGENIDSEVYQKMNFKSGSWTCYYKSDNREDWQRFREDQLSNNHLLTDDKKIEELLMATGEGDQIYLKGYLAEYAKADGSFRRGTSITRTDQGNGACETIYVTDFQILKKTNIFWRSASSLSRYLIITCLIFLFCSLFYRKKI